MIQKVLRGTLAIALSLSALGVLIGCSGATKDQNPALTAKVKTAIAGEAIMTPDDIATVTSTSNGQVIVTLKKNSAELVGISDGPVAQMASGLGNGIGDDYLARVPEATSFEIRDADGKVLATRVRN